MSTYKITENNIEYMVQVYDSGTKIYHFLGKPHRENAPAAIHANGNLEYFINGYLHRQDGPARIFQNDPDVEWYINGKFIGAARYGFNQQKFDQMMKLKGFW